MSVQESIYEQLFALTTIMKQRVVDNFDGDTVNERWLLAHQQGTGSGAMDDAVDGGFKITSGTTIFDSTTIAFNGIHQYEPTGCVLIAVVTSENIANGLVQVGLHSGTIGGNFDSMVHDGRKGTANYRLITIDTTFATVDTGVAVDNNPHSIKLEGLSASVKDSIDGILRATATTQLPVDAQEPYIRARSETASQAGVHKVRYLEAFNT